MQIANKVEQEITQIERQVVRAGGPVSPDDLAQMTHYVRHVRCDACWNNAPPY
ncbi:hypothetical protein M8494_15735 [Serratia ureilytica]